MKRILRQSFSLLNADYVKLNDKWNYRNVISPYHRIYYIDEGEGKLSDAMKTLHLEAGYLYFIPSYTLCDLSCESYLSQYFTQFFEESPDGDSLFTDNRSIIKVKAHDIDIVNFQRLISINPGRGINRSDNPQVYEKNIYYKEYQELNNHQNFSAFIETQGILLQLLSRFTLPEVFHKKGPKVVPVKILDAMRFVMVNLHLPLSVNSLAERANQNPEHFSRIFEQHTGMRPLAYINEKRIARAEHMIASGQTSYSEIGELTGFKSLSNFSRTFKRISGLSPRDYKKKISELVV